MRLHGASEAPLLGQSPTSLAVAERAVDSSAAAGASEEALRQMLAALRCSSPPSPAMAQLPLTPVAADGCDAHPSCARFAQQRAPSRSAASLSSSCLCATAAAAASEALGDLGGHGGELEAHVWGPQDEPLHSDASEGRCCWWDGAGSQGLTPARDGESSSMFGGLGASHEEYRGDAYDNTDDLDVDVGGGGGGAGHLWWTGPMDGAGACATPTGWHSWGPDCAPPLSSWRWTRARGLATAAATLPSPLPGRSRPGTPAALFAATPPHLSPLQSRHHTPVTTSRVVGSLQMNEFSKRRVPVFPHHSPPPLPPPSTPPHAAVEVAVCGAENRFPPPPRSMAPLARSLFVHAPRSGGSEEALVERSGNAAPPQAAELFGHTGGACGGEQGPVGGGASESELVVVVEFKRGRRGCFRWGTTPDDCRDNDAVAAAAVNATAEPPRPGAFVVVTLDSPRAAHRRPRDAPCEDPAVDAGVCVTVASAQARTRIPQQQQQQQRGWQNPVGTVLRVATVADCATIDDELPRREEVAMALARQLANFLHLPFVIEDTECRFDGRFVRVFYSLVDDPAMFSITPNLARFQAELSHRLGARVVVEHLRSMRMA